ncbi:TlpA family protein disulfide reductase [Aestuariibaculum sediminum]|uniref:TlpA family protein disulfide reductase n=1 Tax=Aestuariibaculum sediminum TaxID=2770637 RepID=A0A8J6U948_9FLAO|nr:TlpA disulfide reductase family protein [Aestuariibaculum sediminum]MBD0832577.1 TlpA family protein disulfide reductase [Aestuariibaculum sediminum]
MIERVLISLVIMISLFSCKVENKNDYIILRGKVLNKTSDDLKLTSLVYSDSKYIAINEDGTFVDTLRVDADNMMLFHPGSLTYMYLEAGDDVHLTFDTKDYYNTVHFEGKGAAHNNYLISKNKKTKEVLSGVKNSFLLNETEYKQIQKEIELACLALLSNTKGLPKAYLEKEKRNIRYTTLNRLNEYEANHAYFSKNPDFKVSKGFLKELHELDYNNAEDFIFSSNYSSLISSYLTKQAKKLSDSLNIEPDVAYLKQVNTLTNQTIKNFICYKRAKAGITYTSDLEGYYAEYLKGSTDEENNRKVEESYKALRKLAKGEQSPHFDNYENFDGSTTSLDDLKGKYVYIDVWATWCGPCKREIPYLKEIEKQYHNKNIEFVSISVDTQNNRDKWKAMVEDKELGGVQLLADNAFDSKFVQDYLIKGIPRFILLDPEGNIVTSNAPRPSNEKLIDLFKELNI